MAGGRLQNELKKQRPFESPAQEAVLNLLRTHDRVLHRLERLFRDHGLTHAQYNVLRILRGEGRPLPILEVAARTVAVVPGITGLIDRLERAGLARRERCPEDRRVVYVMVTEHGLGRLAELEEPLRALLDALLGHLTATEVKELIRLLEKVRAPLADPAG